MSEHGQDDGEQVVPVEEARRFADESPILAGMIRRGVPLTRNAYLTLAYGHELPKGDAWTAEHEAGVPHPFQRKMRPGPHRKSA
jgi:hypothetical protein